MPGWIRSVAGSKAASKHATVEELVYLTCATRGCLGFVAEALDLGPTRRVATANERLH
jgi:hypothetical protein